MLTGLGAVLAAGCENATFGARGVDPASGRYAAAFRIPARQIERLSPADPATVSGIAYVRTRIGSRPGDDAYFVTSIRQLDLFTAVVAKDTFERWIIAEGMAGDIPSIDGLTGLSNASRHLGDFAVIDFQITPQRDRSVAAEMVVSRASDAAPLLRVRETAAVGTGLDMVLFEPILNVLADYMTGALG